MSKHEEQLAQLDRELRFYPARCDHPRRLSQAQIQFYNERGYLKGFRIFNDEPVAANRRGFDRLLAKIMQEGRNSYSINGYHARSRMIYDLVTDPLILEYVQDLLGPDVVAWGTHYFIALGPAGARLRAKPLDPPPLWPDHPLCLDRRPRLPGLEPEQHPLPRPGPRRPLGRFAST